jgi:hypothetical protein
MPHLLNFLKSNGTLLTNHHTPLIAHTADDILTSLTGVYPERHGQAVSNSFNYFNPNEPDGLGSTFTTSFTYWTDVVDPSTPSADPSFSLLTPDGKNAPAPLKPPKQQAISGRPPQTSSASPSTVRPVAPFVTRRTLATMSCPMSPAATPATPRSSATGTFCL